jgi:hypothetical protein
MAGKTIGPRDRRTVIAMRRESNTYSDNRPGRVPPADSPNRPELARLWLVALRLSQKRQIRTFTYCSAKFGIVYIGEALCVMDLAWRRVLVKPPTSMAALSTILASSNRWHQ